MKSKKVLLVFPDLSERAWHKGYFHYGLAHVSSFLKETVEGVDISLLAVRDEGFGKTDFSAAVSGFRPSIIGFTATSHSFPLVRQMASWVKDIDNNILTVCGGIHVTMNPEEALSTSELDAVVCGDGEYPMEALVRSWTEKGTVPDEQGLWRRRGGDIVKNGFAAVEDLDSLPHPDWELFDYTSLDEGSQGIGGIMLSRGCPYKCTYCCNHRIANIYRDNKRAYVRFKSVDKSIAEIKGFVGKYPGIHTLYFDDDILPLRKEWFLDFAKRYRDEINMPYWCNIRPNLISEEIVEALASSGCTRAGIGIESGNDYIRNEVLKRNLPEKTLVDAVSLLKKRHIYVYTFNMVGIPKESKEQMLDTIRLNATLNVDKMQCSICYPYEHTALRDFAVSEGLPFSRKSLIEYTQESVMELSRAQRNRSQFTVLTMNLVARAYRIFPRSVSELALRILYSGPSAALALPAVNFLMMRMMASKKMTLLARGIFRLLVPPPPTAADSNWVEKRKSP